MTFFIQRFSFGLLLSILAANSVFGQCNVESRFSTVNTSLLSFDPDTGEGFSDGGIIDFVGLGPFNESSSFATIEAAQISSIVNCVFSVDSSSSVGNGPFVPSVPGAELFAVEGITNFGVEFEILETTSFSLVGLNDGGSLQLDGPAGFQDINSFGVEQLDLSGQLEPGEYSFFFGTFALDPGDSSAGNVVLTITTESVPEPSSLSLLFGAGLMTIARRKRRRRN